MKNENSVYSTYRKVYLLKFHFRISEFYEITKVHLKHDKIRYLRQCFAKVYGIYCKYFSH